MSPVVYEGGISVFLDSEYDTWNMDPQALEWAFQIYPEGKGGFEDVSVWYAGKDPGDQRDLQSPWSDVDNRNKIFTGSSGGVVLTDDEEGAEKVRKWSAQSRERAAWYQHEA